MLQEKGESVKTQVKGSLTELKKAENSEIIGLKMLRNLINLKLSQWEKSGKLEGKVWKAWIYKGLARLLIK